MVEAEPSGPNISSTPLDSPKIPWTHLTHNSLKGKATWAKKIGILVDQPWLNLDPKTLKNDQLNTFILGLFLSTELLVLVGKYLNSNVDEEEKLKMTKFRQQIN